MISYPISLPSSPNVSGLKLVQRHLAAVTRSPFTGNMQTQVWPGEWWEVQGVLPPMKRDGGGADWEGTLRSLRGPQGCFYFGDPAGRVPRGVATGSPFIYGPLQGGGAMLTAGWSTNVTGILKAGDYFQAGYGYNATRIKTSGGSAVTKLLFDAGVSVNAYKYLMALRIVNIGPKTVKVVNSLGGSQNVTTGQELSVLLTAAGDGSTHAQLYFDAPATGDALDFIAWDPVIQVWHFGGTDRAMDQNLIPVANRSFAGWTAFSTATVTLVQGHNQRLYMVLKDANSSADGLAALDIFPSVREGAIVGGLPIKTSAAQGVFQLPGNTIERGLERGLVYGMDFQAVEAI